MCFILLNHYKIFDSDSTFSKLTVLNLIKIKLIVYVFIVS